MSRTTDIALYLPSLRGGGAERVIVTLANAFVHRGYKVDLVLAKAEGPYLAQVDESIDVVDLRSQRVLYSLPGLVGYLRERRPAALLATQTHANVVALWAKKLSRVNARTVIREAITLSINCRASRGRGRLLPFVARWIYRWADRMVAPSQGVAQDLVALGIVPQGKISVIYNPVSMDKVLSLAEVPPHHPWFDTAAYPVVLGVGRLSEQKDFFTLIQAFARVRKQRQARLLILGEGEEREKLEDLVRRLGLVGDVALPGFVHNPYAYMKRAAVFVLSSRWEGLPNVLIEALALGTPVVATDCPSGPREILEDGKWGRLVPVGDVEKMAEAILATLQAPERPSIPKSALARFELSEVVRQYLEVLL